MATAFTRAETSQDYFRIAFAPLSLEMVYQLADQPTNGAVVIMSGMVRNQTAGQVVVALEYQAYEPMALQVFGQIAREIGQRWPGVGRVVIHHRIGKLQVGEISVLVAVGCPHRSEAFSACQFAIDNLKHRAPIWKKEWYQRADGQLSGQWVSIGNCEADS
ncbi:MAG: molybdenum cofactor biosynthesis protein MoaE [Nodosilinea sp.]